MVQRRLAFLTSINKINSLPLAIKKSQFKNVYDTFHRSNLYRYDDDATSPSSYHYAPLNVINEF